jgi:hypothetical protein
MRFQNSPTAGSRLHRDCRLSTDGCQLTADGFESRPLAETISRIAEPSLAGAASREFDRTRRTSMVCTTSLVLASSLQLRWT